MIIFLNKKINLPDMQQEREKHAYKVYSNGKCSIPVSNNKSKSHNDIAVNMSECCQLQVRV